MGRYLPRDPLEEERRRQMRQQVQRTLGSLAQIIGAAGEEGIEVFTLMRGDCNSAEYQVVSFLTSHSERLGPSTYRFLRGERRLSTAVSSPWFSTRLWLLIANLGIYLWSWISNGTDKGACSDFAARESSAELYNRSSLGIKLRFY